MRQIIRSLVFSLLAVAAAVTLAGCFETGAQTTAMAPAAAPPPPAPTSAAPPPAAPRPNAAGRGQSAPPPPPPPAAAEEPEVMTIQRARGQCWMSLENDRKAPRDLEKRAVIVEKCAQEKMAAQPKT